MPTVYAGGVGIGQSKGGTIIARYRSYLVRVWTSIGADGPQWAGRLECMQDDMQHWRFTDPEALVTCVRSVVQESAGRPEGSTIAGPNDVQQGDAGRALEKN